LQDYLIITARYSSSRLPGKILLALGDKSVLGHSISRARAAGFIPLLCTSTDKADDALVSEAAKYGVKSFRGDLLNKIQRWDQCFSSLNLTDAHIVDGDDPYFDTNEISESLLSLRVNELDLVRTSNRSDSGFATVGMSVTGNFLAELANRCLLLPSVDLDVIPWSLLLHPADRVGIAPDSFLIASKSLEIRLTLDYIEDLSLMRTIAKVFDFDTPRKEIEEYLSQNPEILSVNSLRAGDFLANKKVQLEHNFQIGS
jgi:spore coat polysaccharide biosynthesis protein SpsF (cytidylyltransferase family)